MSLSKLGAFLLLTVSARAYIWPSPQLDEIESYLYDQRGYNERGILVGAVTPCDVFNFGNTPGRSNAADWIRTAYHDMATHNIEDGTGGLDASIQFEQDRPENAGDGFFNSVRHLALGIGRYVSVADMLALGAAIAVEQCGGPKIPFRGGRIDATVPNNPGVPQPQEDLASHTASFARQGFTSTEMISLVACGHSFGGVQHSAFPDIVPAGDDPNVDVDATFDTTPFNFDIDVVAQYLNGTTANPLVVGHNETTNSDKRIFSSDGNATMKAFAEDPQSFKATCGNLFARMLDTVPREVTLTEVIEPLVVKPQDVALLYLGDGTIEFSGEVRFWDMVEDPGRSAKIFWYHRGGEPCNECYAWLTHTSDQVATAKNNGDHSVLWYSFNGNTTDSIRLNETQGISKFWFTVEESNGYLTTYNQGGPGFALQDTVMLASSSCVQSSTARLNIALRKDASPTHVYIEFDLFRSSASGATTIEVGTLDASLTSSSSDGSYNIYSVDLPTSAISSSVNGKVNIAADVNGQKVITSDFRPFVDLSTCS